MSRSLCVLCVLVLACLLGAADANNAAIRATISQAGANYLGECVRACVFVLAVPCVSCLVLGCRVLCWGVVSRVLCWCVVCRVSCLILVCRVFTVLQPALLFHWLSLAYRA